MIDSIASPCLRRSTATRTKAPLEAVGWRRDKGSLPPRWIHPTMESPRKGQLASLTSHQVWRKARKVGRRDSAKRSLSIHRWWTRLRIATLCKTRTTIPCYSSSSLAVSLSIETSSCPRWTCPTQLESLTFSNSRCTWSVEPPGSQCEETQPRCIIPSSEYPLYKTPTKCW